MKTLEFSHVRNLFKIHDLFRIIHEYYYNKIYSFILRHVLEIIKIIKLKHYFHTFLNYFVTQILTKNAIKRLVS